MFLMGGTVVSCIAGGAGGVIMIALLCLLVDAIGFIVVGLGVVVVEGIVGLGVVVVDVVVVLGVVVVDNLRV